MEDCDTCKYWYVLSDKEPCKNCQKLDGVPERANYYSSEDTESNSQEIESIKTQLHEANCKIAFLEGQIEVYKRILKEGL